MYAYACVYVCKIIGIGWLGAYRMGEYRLWTSILEGSIRVAHVFLTEGQKKV